MGGEGKFKHFTLERDMFMKRVADKEKFNRLVKGKKVQDSNTKKKGGGRK